MLMNMPSIWTVRQITGLAMKKILRVSGMNYSELQKKSGTAFIFIISQKFLFAMFVFENFH